MWGAGAAVGVSALVTMSSVAYSVLKLGGAAYLVFLGVRLLRTAWRGLALPEDDVEQDPPSESGWSSWRRGALTNLANPKIGAFYVAVLPQFIPDGASPLGMGLLLALVHDVEGMLWFTALILGATRVRRLLRTRRATRAIDGGTGAVLVGVGLQLGLSRG